MPEMTVVVRWPDGSVEECYSPSLVMHDHLAAGTSYAVEEFVRRSGVALHEASERVRARYGVACSSAQASRRRIQQIATAFAPDQEVTVLTMSPPLPTEDTR